MSGNPEAESKEENSLTRPGLSRRARGRRRMVSALGFRLSGFSPISPGKRFRRSKGLFNSGIDIG